MSFGTTEGFTLAFEAAADPIDAAPGTGALVAQVHGRIDDADALIGMFRAIAAELRRTGLHRVMVLDHTVGTVPGEEGFRRMAQALAGEGYETARTAYVDARGTAVGRMELGEIVAREHGYRCRVFGDASRARLWLRYGEE